MGHYWPPVSWHIGMWGKEVKAGAMQKMNFFVKIHFLFHGMNFLVQKHGAYFNWLIQTAEWEEEKYWETKALILVTYSGWASSWSHVH